MSAQKNIVKTQNRANYPTLPWRADLQTPGTGNKDLDEVIANAGYAYDPEQDIFYSTLNPWQRSMGYCRLYDEGAAPFGMIIDSEPIYFQYNNKTWMIAFWKGQYDMVTGGEIGVYTSVVDLRIPGLFKGAFFNSVSDDEMLEMSYTLKKKGVPLFTRQGKHWWLTGFKLGEFSKPSQLTMDVKITLLDQTMRDAFIRGMFRAGYSAKDLTKSGNTVYFTFSKPHTKQPKTRRFLADQLIQWKNKTLCDYYSDITKTSLTLQDKMKVLEQKAPGLYQRSLRMGKSKKGFETYEQVLVSSVGFWKLFSSLFTRIRDKVQSSPSASASKEQV